MGKIPQTKVSPFREREMETMRNSDRASSSLQLPPDGTATSHAHEVPKPLHALFKSISAALYILDFSSNVAAASQYYWFDYGKDNNFEGIARISYSSKNPRNLIIAPGVFIAMTCLMIAGHIACFVFFMVVGLPGEERPAKLRSLLYRGCTTYFLPVVQAKRALQGLKLGLKCSCKRLYNADTQSLRSAVREEERPKSGQATALEAKVEALYAIASATTDGGPLFIFQYLVLSVYGTITLSRKPSSGSAFQWTPSLLLITSLCLSAMSATWNVARAIVFLLPSKSKWLTVAAGVFTFSALTVRCTSLVSLTVVELLPFLSDESIFDEDDLTVRNEIFIVTIFPVIYFLLILVVPWLGYLWISWKSTSDLTCNVSSLRAGLNHMLTAATYTWVSFPFGPLYPICSAAQTTAGGIFARRFQVRVILYTACRWVTEISLITVLHIKHGTPCDARYGYEQGGYETCPMIPCPLYIAVLATTIPAAILSETVFLKLVQKQLPYASQVGDEESELKQEAADATLEVAIGTLDIISFG